MRTAAIAVSCCAALVCGARLHVHGQEPAAAETRPAFTDVTDSCGAGAILARQYEAVANWWFSGMTLADLDGDGDLDLHLAGHGSAAAAGANDGKGNFVWVDPKADVPRGRGRTGEIPFGGGEIRMVFDLDEDGRLDMLCSYGDGLGVAYLNAGKGPAWGWGPHEPGFDPFSRAVALADVNRDGKVDCLYTGDGRRGVLNVALGAGGGKWQAGPAIESLRESGAIVADIDGDGDLDLLLSQRGYNPAGRRIMLNDGKMGFRNATKDAGLDEDGGSIHGVGDVDQDGHLDLICIEGKEVVIYLNDGHGRFTRKAQVDGLAAIRARPASANWGGAVVTDVDNDGRADVLVNGKNFLYILRGLGGGRLRAVNAEWGIPSAIAPAVDEGLCFGDIDGDGDLDVITYGRGPDEKRRWLAVLRNDLPRQGWVRARLVGRPGNAAATGARISLYEAGGLGQASVHGKLLWFEQVCVWGRQSFHSYYFPPRTQRHFGLGGRPAVDVSVEFCPSGKRVERRSVPAGGAVELVED